MSLRIGDEAPDFTAQTTQGEVNFHQWIGDGYAVLFSHPKDFTPVCTTELGYMAGLKKDSTRATPRSSPEHRFGRGSQALVEGYRGRRRGTP